MLEKFSRHEKSASALTGLELSGKNSHPCGLQTAGPVGHGSIEWLEHPGMEYEPPSLKIGSTLAVASLTQLAFPSFRLE